MGAMPIRCALMETAPLLFTCSMLMPLSTTKRCLALSVTAQGIGYCVFEGPLLLVDWGVTRTPRPRSEVPRSILRRFAHYRPHLVVLDDGSDCSVRKSAETRRLITACAHHAHVLGIPVVCYSRPDVRQCFASFNARTKDQIAAAIVHRLPELHWQSPAKRRIWTTEDRRHGIFAAVSLALTHFQRPRRPAIRRWC